MKHPISIKTSQLANSKPKQATLDHVQEVSHLPKPQGNHKYQRIKEVNQQNVHKHFKYQTEERPTRNKLQMWTMQITKCMNQSKNKSLIKIGVSRWIQMYVAQDLKWIEQSRT